jgi:hypothetical protein
MARIARVIVPGYPHHIMTPPQRWQTEKTTKLIFRFFTLQTEGNMRNDH